MDYLFLIAGFALLLAGGHYLVSGGVSLARHLRISTLVVGITVIAFGTSAPELIVSMKANFQGHPDISIGNVIGSNIANIALVLAITTVIFPISLLKRTIVRDWLAMVATYIALVLFAINDVVEQWEGLLLVAALIFFVVSSIRKSRNTVDEETEETPQFNIWISVLLVLLAIGALSYGADLLVGSAAGIARKMGVGERVISVSLIAFGTSVPELATSVAAAVKKQLDISIGNIIGSNIFNVLAVIGISASTKRISIDSFLQSYAIDFVVMFASALLLLFAIMPLRRGKIDRWKGILLFLGYVGYIYIIY